MITRSFVELTELLLRCRDVWHRFNRKLRVRDKLFTDFSTWVLSIHSDDGMETPPDVLKLLQTSTAPYPYTLYAFEDLKEKLRDSNIAKAYRLAHAIDQRDGERDRRVRDLFEYILEHEYEFSSHALVCQFFTYLGYSKKNKGKGNLRFGTRSSTRFQQLLFMTVILELSSMSRKRNRTIKRLKASKKLVSAPKSFPIPGKLQDMGQRIGFAIQTVVESWDIFARHLGLKDAEDMTLPYAILSIPDLRFKCIKSRAEGFVRNSQATNFTAGATCTTIRCETFEQAADRPSDADEYLREFVDSFLNDVYNSGRSASLYTIANPQGWHFRRRFVLTETFALPARFRNISREKIDAVRKESVRQIPASVDREKDNDMRGECYGSGQDQKERETFVRNQRVISGCSEDGGTDQKFSKEDVDRSKDVLRRTMEPIARMWRCDFRHLAETDEILSRQPSFTGKVQLSLHDPRHRFPQNPRDQQGGDHILTDDDMNELVNLMSEELQPGGHGILFCRMREYGLWERIFKVHPFVMTQSSCEEVLSTFIIAAPIILVSDTLPFTSPREMKSEEYCSDAAQFALHVIKRPAAMEQQTTLADENVVGLTTAVGSSHVPCSFPNFVNVIDNIRDLIPPEHDSVVSVEAMDRSEVTFFNRPLDLSKELINRYTRPGDLVLDRFARKFSVAIACITLPERRAFLGCERNPHLYKAGVKEVLNTFAELISRSEANQEFSEEAMQAANILCLQAAKDTGKDTVWEVPGKLPAYQTFPPHIIT